jgi:hypothetical protein
MTVGKILGTGLKIGAVCLVFALTFIIGGALSGLTRIGQQPPDAANVGRVPSPQPAVSPQQETTPRPQAPQMPANFLLAFAAFPVCAGIVVSYLILRSSWHGWRLAGAIAISIYGVSIVGTQVESLFFLSGKLPQGLIGALFLQGAIATVLFAPLAVLLLGKWRSASPAPVSPGPARLRASSAAWRLAVIVIAFVFLYFLFGYYVAWQNPALRQYYGGPEYASFYASLKANWMNQPSIYPLQVFRALLYAACLYPLVRMLRTMWWETALAMALFLSVWTTMLLLPNPTMPASVAHSHFRETLGFSLVFGALAGWLMSTPRKHEPRAAGVAA